MKKTLFLIAGEISGDSHGSALLDALPPDQFSLSGLGGPKMNARSDEIEDWLADAAVLGLWEVLKKYWYFRNKMEETVQRIHALDPDGIVLIDYPGFNLRLARRLREQGYRGKLIYYISPQVWAWKQGRIKVMAELLDLMICIFPFEKEIYESSGLETVFCGHPLVDSLAGILAQPIERETDLVALLPGSREREIEALFPPMLEAAHILAKDNSQLRFVTSGATPALTDRLAAMAENSQVKESLEIHNCAGHEIMRRAEVGVVASGTATLEAAILGLPYCLTYKVSPITAFAARRVLKIQLSRDRQCHCRPGGGQRIVAGRRPGATSLPLELDHLLSDEVARRVNCRISLHEISSGLGRRRGAHEKAASAVTKALAADVVRCTTGTWIRENSSEQWHSSVSPIGLVCPRNRLHALYPAQARSPRTGSRITSSESRRPVSTARMSTGPISRRFVTILSSEIGERNLGKPESLERSAIWLESTLKGGNLGYEVERQIFQADGRDARNLVCELIGLDRKEEIVLVGAPYDTVAGSPGANASASGVAAVLSLAQAFAGDPQSRFCFFANEKRGNPGGVEAYLDSRKEKDDTIVAMLLADSIGYYNEEAGGQRYPESIDSRDLPRTADFLLFTAPKSFQFRSDSARNTFSRTSGIDALSIPDWPVRTNSSKRSFAIVTATDTSRFRNPRQDEAGDTVNKIDMARLEKVCQGLEAVVRNWANP